MSEFNIEDLDAVISEAKSSLVQMLALQLKNQLKHGAELAQQLANAESKCRELVAENAGLKKAAEFSTAEDMWIEQADGMLDYQYVDWYVDVLKAAMETPSTDAFLAEVRASGVDAAIEHLNKKFTGTGHIGVPVMALEWLAQELRKGAAA